MKNKSIEQNHDICVGVITAVNGVKGYVKIRSFTDRPSDIANFENLYDPESSKIFKLKLISEKKDYIIAAIDGICNRNDAELLRNTKLYINRAELPETQTEEYYHVDLIGMQALSEDGIVIGIVKNVVNFGAGDILEVYDTTSEKTIYYPFTKQFVPIVSLLEKNLILRLSEETIAALE